MKRMLGLCVVSLAFGGCLAKRSTSDAAASQPAAKGYCEKNPINGKDQIPPELLAFEITDSMKLSDGKLSEEEVRSRVAVWRSICGPTLKKTSLYGKRWNFHTGVCRYVENKGEIISEGQISNSLSLQIDTQSYYGFRYKRTGKAWNMVSSYLYSTDKPNVSDLYEVAQNPVLYGLFQKACTTLVGGSCPLPITAADLATKVDFLRAKLDASKAFGKAVLETAGVDPTALLGIKPGSTEDMVPALVSQVGLACLQQASARETNIGINSSTEVVTIFDQVQTVIKTNTEAKRVAMFGNHWNIKPVHTVKEGAVTKVCGQISRTLSFNDDDQVFFTAEFNGDELTEAPKIMTKKGSLLTGTANYAFKLVELYNQYQSLVGKQQLFVPISSAVVNAALEVGRNTNKLIYGNDWEKAAIEIVQVMAILGKDEGSKLATGCPVIPAKGQWGP